MKFGLRYASLGRYANGPAAVELAQAAEAAGFDSIWTVEHVVVPHGYQSRYPYSETDRMGSGLEDLPIPDPLIWLAYIASATRTLKLGTAILILPQRNPVVTAKAVATLDHLAGGRRVLLGIGVGWLAEEFATLGVPFEDRGPRTDEYVAAMRARGDRGARPARRETCGRPGELSRRASGPGEDARRCAALRQDDDRALRRVTRAREP